MFNIQKIYIFCHDWGAQNLRVGLRRLTREILQNLIDEIF